MKYLIPTLLLVFALVFSCKKKDESAPPNITTTGATTSSTAGTTTGGGTPVSFNSMCSNQKIYSILTGVTYSVTNAQNTAMFTSSTLNNFSSPGGPFLNAGTVSLNNKVFKSIFFSYADTTNVAVSSPFIWVGTGSVVPAFTVTNNNPYATYADFVYWPDTISKSENFTITLTGSHYADEVQVLISKSGSSAAASYTALTSAGAVTVTASGLAALATTTSAVIQCNFYKNNVQTIGTNQINFRNITSFIKTVQVKN